MTKLPAKELLDGSKLPKTTTGEMKDALGKLRDYLSDLLGEDSADREAARLALGIDLTGLGAQIGSKSDRTELETRAKMLEAEIAKRGIPVGSIDWFAAATPPAGYLKADGAAVGRQTYPDLFAAIGTTYGEGDGETTFNLPDLIGRFAEGSETPGTVKEAGLPNIKGFTDFWSFGEGTNKPSGAFYTQSAANGTPASTGGVSPAQLLWFDASRSNPIYGVSDIVQPPALTLLPCIKAFDATVNTGLIDVTALAQETANKTDKSTAANAPMPSRYKNALSAQNPDTTYTAPEAGYFFVRAVGASAGGYITLNRRPENTGAGAYVPSGKAVKIFLPVKKGQEINYVYEGITAESMIYFEYAEGSQP